MLLFLLFFPFGFNQPCFIDSTGNQEQLAFENHIFRKNIKTVLLYREGNELSSPSIELNSGNKLKLRFDDLEGDEKTYNYTFIHCTADWQVSDLNEFDYMSGYADDRITVISYSFNTNQRFSHYSLEFPNENIQLTKSGNYILKVFSDYDRSSLVLTRRFVIFENRVNVIADIHKATIAEDRRGKQEVDFTIQHNGVEIQNPFADLKVVIQQNDRWDNVISGLKPIFVRDKELVYDYETENLFNGGSEFRPFDFRTTKMHSERVEEITYEALNSEGDSTAQKFLHIYLLPDDKKSYKSYYSSKADLNGKFLVTTQDVISESAATDADYAFVHFSLPLAGELKDGNLFVGGALSDWAFSPENKMHYNFIKKSYECTLFLKQGYYNYAYYFLPEGSTQPDETFIEGNHSETENAYTIYVYHRAFGSRYDTLIGMRFLNSTFGFKY